MAKSETYVIRGKIHWAKVFGQPRMNEHSGEREWSFDLTPNAAGRELAKKEGFAEKLRQPKGNDKRNDTYFSFRQREFRNGKDGEKIANDPIRVIDAEGKAWPETKLLGNESDVDVKFVIKDNGRGRQKGMYAHAIRVLNLVPFEVQDFAPLDEDDEFYDAKGGAVEDVDTKGEAGNPDDLDDDIPF